MRTLLTFSLTAALLAGCATPYTYSQINGQRYYRAPIDTYPLLVLGVDGKDTPHSPVLLDPGLRSVRVQGPIGGAGYGQTRTISLEVKPCTRYYLVAVKGNRLASDFEVRVDHEETIGGCTVKAARA